LEMENQRRSTGGYPRNAPSWKARHTDRADNGPVAPKRLPCSQVFRLVSKEHMNTGMPSSQAVSSVLTVGKWLCATVTRPHCPSAGVVAPSVRGCEHSKQSSRRLCVYFSPAARCFDGAGNRSGSMRDRAMPAASRTLASRSPCMAWSAGMASLASSPK
jgi:hypothetical protein